MSCDPSFLWQTRSTQPICSNIILLRLLIGCSAKKNFYNNGRLPLPKIHARSLQIYGQFIFAILISTHYNCVSLLFFHIFAPSEFFNGEHETSRMHRFFSTNGKNKSPPIQYTSPYISTKQYKHALCMFISHKIL